MNIQIGFILFSIFSLSNGEDCADVGFFRAEDCTAFYRCVDFYGIGKFTKFDFQCPGGLVFDESLSVCNWPWASAPCEEPTTVGEEITTVGEEMTTVGEEMTTGGEDITTLEPEDTAEPEEGSDNEEGAEEEEDSQNVIIVPSFDFTCTGEGLFGHDSNCAKFWLCKESDGNLEPAELYRCPDGYSFDDSILRCQKEEDVECDKVPDTVQERLERPAITLQVSELESFFRTWSF